MATVVGFNDILESRVVCWEPTDSQLSINTMNWFVLNYAGPPVTLTQLAQAQDVAINATYKAWMGATAQYRGVGFTRIAPGLRTVEEFTTANNGAGTTGAGICPQQASGVVTKHTIFAGRHYRGRIYPGFPSSNYSDTSGNMNGAGFTALTNLAAAFPLTLLVGGVPICNAVIRQHVSPHITQGVISMVPPQRFATQRRRGQFGRTNILPW